MPNIQMEKKYEDIHKRIYKFVIKVLLFLKKLPNTPENRVIRYQLAKSVTSMGANDQEADGASSHKDFANKYNIVKKEGKETNYWLNVIKDINPEFAKEAEELIKECTEIIKIVSTIIHKTKTRFPK